MDKIMSDDVRRCEDNKIGQCDTEYAAGCDSRLLDGL